MNIAAAGHGWSLFAGPPSPPDSEVGERLDEMLHEAQDVHKDHFERRVEAAHVPQAEPASAAAPEASAAAAAPSPPRNWPKTIAVSVVLLAVAGLGTLASSIINALINKKVIGKSEGD